MAYQVIARKYRPQRFEDVVGQEHVTETLAHAIEQKRIAHAYIFCGPRGTGKTTIARIFAKALNITGGPKADFDVNDPKAVEIAEGRYADALRTLETGFSFSEQLTPSHFLICGLVAIASASQMADARGAHTRLDLAHGLGRGNPGGLVDK